MTTAPEAPAPPAAALSPALPSTAAETDTRPSPNRRQVILAAGVGAGALTLAACGSSTTASTPATSSSADATTSAAAPSSSEAATSSSAAASSSSDVAPSSSAGGAPSSSVAGSSAAAGGAALADLSGVPVGGAIGIKNAAGKPVIIAQPTAGKAVGFSAICTHKGCTVAPVGAELHCPCHGSKFNALTGAVINGPAAAPLHPFAVSVKDGKIVAA